MLCQLKGGALSINAPTRDMRGGWTLSRPPSSSILVATLRPQELLTWWGFSQVTVGASDGRVAVAMLTLLQCGILVRSPGPVDPSPGSATH